MTEIETLTDGKYTAVVDSIEEDLAIVFFEQDGEEVGNTVLNASELPEAARHADAILSITIEDCEIVETDYEPKLTETRQAAAQDRFDRLSSRPPSDEES